VKVTIYNSDFVSAVVELLMCMLNVNRTSVQWVNSAVNYKATRLLLRSQSAVTGSVCLITYMYFFTICFVHYRRNMLVNMH